MSTTTPEAVRAWLAEAVAKAAGLDPRHVDPHRPIAEFGLGSRQLVSLGGELAEWTGRPVEASLVFDHPTIAALTDALFAHAPSDAGPSPAAGRPSPPDASGRSAGDTAIVSMACRFPGGAGDPEALWRLLDTGQDVISEVPQGRWDTHGLLDPDPGATGKAYSLRGGFLDGIDRFDASFFGISPREAAAMDPQQRLLLQTAWETFERAGIVPATLNGSNTGVYVGLYDSGYLAAASLGQLDGHVGTGSAPSVASGRIAYTLGLQGPAVTVDTACSSSLVALHLAARALAAGECDLALAGGATLLVTPRGHVEFSRLRGLSPSGRCSPFSADADGVVWAEGCGLVLLKRLDDARRDGDRVLAVVKGSALNQDGRSQGLSAPSGPAQERVLRAALDAAGLRPRDIDHVEAHGTGTPLGDPIEGNALAAVFGQDRPAGRPLGVGSLKSNIGHSQAAAGVAGVIKTVLALAHERVPASLHAHPPTRHIAWDGAGLRVQDTAEAWPRRADRVRRAGVSAFGISGTNAHVILEEPPQDTLLPDDGPPAAEGPDGVPPGRDGSRPLYFPLSACGLTALRGQAARLARAVGDHPHWPPAAVAATLAHHRTHFGHRAVVRAADRAELLAALGELADGRSDPERTAGPAQALPGGKVAFVFPGQGAQWTGMARDLLAHDPVFADEIDRCDGALRPFTEWSVAAVLRGDPGSPSPDRVDVVQPVLFAVMVSLAAVWRARGVRPDAVVGHSQGEVAAACVAGALSLSDAAAVVALRARALTALSGTGGMAVVGLPRTEVEERLAGLGAGVCVAAVNSGRSTVVAGEPGPLLGLIEDLEREQVFVRRLDVDYASHSAGVEPVRDLILDELDGVTACPASVAWYSTVTGEPVTEELEAGYWYTNLREPVRFAATVERLVADGHRFFVELGPHPSLSTALRTVDEDLVVVASLRRDADGPACLDRAAAELYVHGGPVDRRRPAPGTAPLPLPTYAWDTRRYWTEPETASAGPGLLDRAAHPLLGIQLRSADASRWTFRGEWSPATAGWLPDHTVFGRTVVSGTTLLELCRAALGTARPDEPGDLTGLLLLAPLTLPATGTAEVSVEVVVEGPGAEITVHSRPRGQEAAGWTLHATASAAPAVPAPADRPPAWPEDGTPAWTPETYERLAGAGLGYGPAFRGVREAVRTGDGELIARLSLPGAARDSADPYPVHPALLDAALHTAAAFGAADGRVHLPVAVGRCVLPPGGAGELVAAVRRTGTTATDLTLDVTLWDTDGFPAGRLEDVRLRAVTPADLTGGPANAGHLYEVAWTAVDPVAAAPGAWTLVGAPRALPGLRAAGIRVGDRGADVAVRFWPGTGAGAEPGAAAREGAAEALAELRELIALPPGRAPARTVWVTRGAIAAGAGDAVPDFARSVLWGLARTARSEHPGLGLSLLDIEGSEGVEEALIAAAQSDEPELAHRGGALLAPRLVRARPADGGAVPADGTVLITGGLGAVGLHIARLLAEQGVPRLVLTSRRGAADPRAASAVAELAALGAEAETAACDVTDADALADVVASAGERLPLRGVVHCAGVLDDGVLAELTPERLARVLGPKAEGAAHLHRLTAGLPLEMFLLVSSAAGVLGNAGQANYAAANVFLDQLAHHRRARGLPGVSVSFGAWAGEGLAAGHADLARMARLGHRALTAEQGRDLVALAVRRDTPHLVAWALDLPRLRESVAGDALWRDLLPAPRAATAAGEGLAGRLAALPEDERAARLLALVREEAARALGLRSAEAVRPDLPLRELGMDSVTAVELRNRISGRLSTRLPATLLFDHPTPTRLTTHLLATLPGAAPRPTAATAPADDTAGRAHDEPIAIVGMACRLPGGVEDPDGLWRLVAEGRDGMVALPDDRGWDLDGLFDADPDKPGTAYVHKGGFLHSAAQFDAGFFGISPREALAMDPQQRLLLETSWEALERSGIDPRSARGENIGVFSGVSIHDYVESLSSMPDELEGFVTTATAGSVASGRVSYVFGFEGPAVTVDTACSSSLVAIHLAAQALRQGECSLALAGGVAVMGSPIGLRGMSRQRGLAADGRVKAFSAGADGTILSEGVGIVVLERLSEARRRGHRVLAVVRGSAVNQDGASNGLTAPNGPSQQRVIRKALANGGLAAADIDVVEAHGTGTELGDPIEAQALLATYGRDRDPERPLRLGSLKSNVGHTQAAAGVSAVIKMVQALRHGIMPPTLNVTEPTPQVDWTAGAVELLTEARAWPEEGRPRRAGVSSFGISGTNAHLILEQAPQEQPAAPAASTPGVVPLVVSAASTASLAGQAARLTSFLKTETSETAETAPLDAVAAALVAQRAVLSERAVVVAGSWGEAVAGLEALGRGDSHPGVVAGGLSSSVVAGRTVVVFPGQGSQWVGMGRELLDSSGVFAERVGECAAALEPWVDWSLMDVLRGDASAALLERVDVVQPASFAVMVGLAAVWA
ncbi:SDR family NAD(P)-dependent oxidoreductase, partial [Streptomyces asoensis]